MFKVALSVEFKEKNDYSIHHKMKNTGTIINKYYE